MSSLFTYIKTKIPILDLIGQYTTLKQAGIYFKGICPFHGEKTASFTVSPHKDIFYCFGCHATGDVISFIAKIENFSQIDAAKHLIERYNLPIPKEIDKDFSKSDSQINNKEQYFQICKLVAQWCSINLQENAVASDYLKKRQINKDSIDRFSIGYFPAKNTAIKSLLKFIAKHGLLAKDLIEANILIENKTLYSPFEDRIIFPIRDQLGRFCGFGARVFKEHDERAKYYNSHEHQFFNKGSILFGLDLAKKSIQENNSALLVEGYTDCIAMAQHGFTNCVATLGTSCTIEHLKLLSRFTQKIYVLYDGDQAGQKAILRLTEMCWNVNLEIRVVCFSQGEDPASYLNNNGNLQALIINAKDIYSFFIDTSSSNFGLKTLHEKIWTVKKLIDIIRNIDDSLKRDILLQDIANKLNVPLESLKKNIESENLRTTQKNNQLFKADYAEIQISDLEKRLFSIVMNNFELLTPSNYYLCNFFASPAKEILLDLIKLNSNNERLSLNDLLQTINDEKSKAFINKMLLEYDESTSKDFTDLIQQFKKKNWKKISEMVKQKLTNAQSDSDKQFALNILSEFKNLKERL